MSSTRYQQLSDQSLQDDLVWIKGADGDPYIFRAATVDIDAPLEVVWDVVQDLNHYHQFSRQTIDINLSGKLELGSTFDIHLYPGTLKGFFIPLQLKPSMYLVKSTMCSAGPENCLVPVNILSVIMFWRHYLIIKARALISLCTFRVVLAFSRENSWVIASNMLLTN